MDVVRYSLGQLLLFTSIIAGATCTIVGAMLVIYLMVSAVL